MDPWPSGQQYGSKSSLFLRPLQIPSRGTAVKGWTTKHSLKQHRVAGYVGNSLAARRVELPKDVPRLLLHLSVPLPAGAAVDERLQRRPRLRWPAREAVGEAFPEERLDGARPDLRGGAGGGDGAIEVAFAGTLTVADAGLGIGQQERGVVGVVLQPLPRRAHLLPQRLLRATTSAASRAPNRNRVEGKAERLVPVLLLFRGEHEVHAALHADAVLVHVEVPRRVEERTEVLLLDVAPYGAGREIRAVGSVVLVVPVVFPVGALHGDLDQGNLSEQRVRVERRRGLRLALGPLRLAPRPVAMSP